MIPKKVVHLLSGGLDSTVLLYDLIRQKCEVHCVLFNYKQKHAWREIPLAVDHCTELGVKWTEIQLPEIAGSTLTDGSGSKIVPNRNAIFLSHAVAIAVRAGAGSVTYACNRDDAADFPDCRRKFVDAMNALQQAAATGVEICAPYIDLTKREIVAIGRKLGVEMERTYSCYAGGQAGCGVCDACKARAKAMA